ncbi:MAG TPA: AsnC family protein [Azospirillaceae bacterium]|nr:AsnC family protein [Azospirillaceae bacterium]
MMVDEDDRRLLAALQDGLPQVPHPFAAVAARLELDEAAVIARLSALVERGVVKRCGLVVRHHELGWRANAMVVWDVPDDRVDAAGRLLAGHPFVTLCYRRPRHPPAWPYNLFCMIHGRDRATVEAQIGLLCALEDMAGVSHAVLFSRRRFKQCGARLARSEAA